MVTSETIVRRDGSSITYHSREDLKIPKMDLLSFLFDSEHCAAKESTILHCDAANPSLAITKAEMRVFIQEIAFSIRNKLGVGKGNHVTYISSGSFLAPAVFFGCVAAGTVFCPSSPSSTVSELIRALRISESSLIVCNDDTLQVALKAGAECSISRDRILIVDAESKALRSHATGINVIQNELLQWERSSDEEYLNSTAVCLIFSSGTTGLPKGTPITHRNMVTQAVCAWGTRIAEVRAQSPDFEYSTLAHLPFAHIAGISSYFIAPFIMSGTVFWMPKFKYPEFLEYHRQLKLSFCLTVPPICLLIANDSNVGDHFNDLKFIIAGAAPMGPELQHAVSAKLGRGKTMVSQTYGMSEVAGSTTCLAYGETDMTASVGRLLQNLDARIVSEDDIDVEPGQEGELLLNGPTVFKGYHKEHPSSDVFDSNGWFRTGDVVRFENGLFYVVDRKKEMIKYKGNQVAPAELEGLLLSHPQISDAAVIGISSKGTEVPQAYIVARDADISAKHISTFIKERVSNHKQLRGGVVFVDQIPKSPSGKVLRRVLKNMSRADIKAKGAKL